MLKVFLTVVDIQTGPLFPALWLLEFLDWLLWMDENNKNYILRNWHYRWYKDPPLIFKNWLICLVSNRTSNTTLKQKRQKILGNLQHSYINCHTADITVDRTVTVKVLLFGGYRLRAHSNTISARRLRALFSENGRKANTSISNAWTVELATLSHTIYF